MSNQQQSQEQQTGSQALVGTTCMELALEGERLCKTGDFKNGVTFFEEAIKVGTNDDRNLSAIYSQLGNAYYYMGDYSKALEYHKLDVALVHRIGDEIAEAKACGNLGNTFKMLDKFEEAAIYCRRYLEISRKLEDKVGEGKALYNLGNVYYTQGRRMISSNGQQQQQQTSVDFANSELSPDIKSCLQKAIEYYEANLEVVSKLNDLSSMGRAYGNLGNTHYLLGDFEAAVENHKQRLELARQTKDNCAERRAHLNLGNANVFLGKFQEAIENYSATLKIAQEIQDKYASKNIADSCYSLANTYTFLRDYKSAIEYHLKYLEMIKDNDEEKLGEGRACWSLVNIYQMVNDPESALVYARRHYEIAELLRDHAGLASAKLNIDELEEIIAQKQAVKQVTSASQLTDNSSNNTTNLKHGNKKLITDIVRLTPDKRQEQEQRRFKKQLNSNLTSDIDGLNSRRKSHQHHHHHHHHHHHQHQLNRAATATGPIRSNSSERLFDMIAHFQSGRIDDQRCEVTLNRKNLNGNLNKNSAATISSTIADNKENQTTSDRTTGNSGGRGSQPLITNPINAVSSAIKATYRKASLVAYPTSSGSSHATVASVMNSQRRPTVSHEHREELFDLIAGAQGQRMEEQRASLPAFTFANGVLKNPTNITNQSQQISNKNDRPTLRGQQSTTTASSAKNSGPLVPETIKENQACYGRENRSNSIVAPSVENNTDPKLIGLPNRANRLTRQFQTMDADAQVHDDRFLDSLMKYQSTRFNDQRSEFPKNRSNTIDQTGHNQRNQANDFFNLIVKFQSDRIEDQRSAPPVKLTTNESSSNKRL